MKIFVAGATGAIGKRLVPLLLATNHDVIATTRSPEKLPWLSQLGAKPVLLNGLDHAAVMRAVMATSPDAIVHQMTALASVRSLKNFDEEFAMTNRLRSEGTRNLLAAAQAVGVRMFVAQSFTGWPNERKGGRIKVEEDPFDRHVPDSMTKSLAAIRTQEEIVSQALGVTGIVLRYGNFYGPGTSIALNGEIVELVRSRKLPIVGNGAGVWSFVHVDDAARATALALEHALGGVFNIVDNEPAEVSVWLPELARAVGARSPRRLPAWLARWLVGEAGILMMTQARGSSNTKAKATLGWQPEFATWRDGFRRGLSATPSAVAV